MMQIPEKLKQRLEKLGLDETIYEQRTRKCMLSKEALPLEKVPWYEHAYFVDETFEDKKDTFIFDPLSLVPCLALEPKKTDKILDMCAAPGTKTFILSFLTDNEAHIVANDISRNRIRRLRHVVNKFSISAEIRNLSGRKIAGKFNKILLDAPCSGEGMVNKKEKLFEHWSEKRIRLLSKKQKKLLVHAFELLERDGTLVYSTCTLAPEENEEVVDFLLSRHSDAKMDNINLNVKHADGLTAWEGRDHDERLRTCIRIYPQHNGMAGFFVAKIRKM